MNARSLILALAISLLMLLGSLAIFAVSVTHAAQHADPPTTPCNGEQRMNVVIINGVWFECVCERLMLGHVCDWYELGPAPALRKTKHRRLVPVLVVNRVVVG